MARAEGATGQTKALQARDVVAFGQEYGRVLSDGRIVGRAEPFAKVFPSSRAVKRAVGVTAWAILEDIALDASIDVEGRLVAETNVRRIAANLGLAPNTVTKHLGVLREHGFVLHEEQRDVGSGRYETSRYVLDPSACLERFTVTPRSAPDSDAPDDGSQDGDRTGVAASQDVRHGPCRTNCDTEPTVSQTTGHRDLRQNNKKKVGFQEPTQPDGDAVAALTARLTALGVDAGHAAKLAADHPPHRIVDALDAAEVERPRSPAGWVVAAIRNGWDVRSPADQHRAERARRRRREQRQADRSRAQRHADDEARRADGWAAAVSDALDDRQLAAAIDRITQPLPTVGRRPVPMVRAQLIAWAAALHAIAPSQPLSAVLDAALATAAGDDPPPHSGDLSTPPPPPSGDPRPLDRRIAACLHDLDQRPPTRSDKEQL